MKPPCPCGQPHHANGFCQACNSRWSRAGRPGTGPPPPMSAADKGALSSAAKADPYDLQWIAGAGERRVMRVRRQAAHMVQVVQARDAAGFARLLEKVTDPDALYVVLAECADPARTTIVTGVPVAGATLAAPGRLVPRAGAGTPEPATAIVGPSEGQAA
jgi:hypothetical protein